MIEEEKGSGWLWKTWDLSLAKCKGFYFKSDLLIQNIFLKHQHMGKLEENMSKCQQW